MKRCLYLAMILGLLAGLLPVLLPASPALAANYTVTVKNVTVYQDSTGQTTNVVVTDVPGTGLTAATFTLTCLAGSGKIVLKDVTAGPNFEIVTKTINSVAGTATVSVLGTYLGTPPPPASVGDVVLATMVFDVKSGLGGSTTETVTPSAATLWDSDGATVAVGGYVAGTVTIQASTEPACTTSWVPVGSVTDKAGVKISIGKGAGTGGAATLYVYPSSYKATSGYTPATLVVVGVTGIPTWTAIVDPSTTPGSFVFTGTRTPGAELDAAFLGIELVGNDTDSPTLNMTWNILRGDCGSGSAGLITTNPLALQFMRGDIDGNAVVDFGDYVVGKRYLLGLSVSATFNPVNFACIVHDVGGDVINAKDLYQLKRHLAGLPDA